MIKLRNAPNAYSQQRVISKQYNTIIGEVPVTDALCNILPPLTIEVVNSEN